MTVTLETSRDVRLSLDAFWRIVDDARLATRQDLLFRHGRSDIAEWDYKANGDADKTGLVGPILATVTRD